MRDAFVISALDSGSSGPCSWARHFILTVPRALHPGVEMGTAECNAAVDPVMD